MEIIAGTYHYQDLSFATSNLANGMLVPAPALQFGQFFEFFQHAAPHCKWRLYWCSHKHNGISNRTKLRWTPHLTPTYIRFSSSRYVPVRQVIRISRHFVQSRTTGKNQWSMAV